MKYKMCRLQCVLALVVLHVGLAHSWDIAIAEGELLKFYINETQVDTVPFTSQNLTSIAYDEVHNAILYVDKQTDKDALYSYNLSSMKYKYLIERSGRQIHGLAFDPVTERLFFTDIKERSINWFSLKPGFKNNVYGNLLLKMDDGIPTDIAVDSCKGYIYWMNINSMRSSIERARFNGTDRKVVIDTDSLSINTTYELESHSLIIDQNTHKMYWSVPKTRGKNFFFRSLVYYIYRADLDGKNVELVSMYTFGDEATLYPNPSHIMTVFKNSLITSLGWCNFCRIREQEMLKSNKTSVKRLFRLHSKSPVSITANYKIKDQIQGIQDCEALTSLVRNYSMINDSSKIAIEDDGPFCVHGAEVHEQSVCKCTPGYTGERCDVSVCENYCLQGNCSVSDEGLPKCRCNTGYSGERCEVDVCYGYCSNNGTCSLNEENEPACQCIGGYVGDRCDVTVCLNYCLQGYCSANSDGLPVCRCNSGYFGERCEVDVCYGYCSNNGTCSLNEKSEPVCQCVGNYEGSRCEIGKHVIVSLNDTPKQYSTERNLTLTDLLSNWRKHTKISVVVEV